MTQRTTLNNYSISQKMSIVKNWVSNPKHRNVYEARISQNLTYEELGEQFGYSTNHIGNIIHECENAVLNHLDEAQIIPTQLLLYIDNEGYLKVKR